MSASIHRDHVARLRKEIADLDRQAADYRLRANRERDGALRAASSITKSTSPSTARSKLEESQRYENRAVDQEKRAADASARSAAKTKQLHSAEASLDRALEQDRRKSEAHEQRRHELEKRHIAELERRRRAVVSDQLPRILGAARPGPTNAESATPTEYDVCLSFAGEERAYVELVARLLKEAGLRVFYDEDEKASLWGKDLVEHFDWIYGRGSRYCVMFISAAYVAKPWTRLERRSALARALTEDREYILPARFDGTELPGMPPTIAYIDLADLAPATLVEFVLKKVGGHGTTDEEDE